MLAGSRHVTSRRAATTAFKHVWSNGSAFPSCISPAAGSIALSASPTPGLLTLTEMVNKAREIVDAVNIPIVSDCETGYGNAVNVTRAVREFENAGVAALHIEDQMTPKRAGHEGFDVGLVSREEFVNKIKAAARHSARCESDHHRSLRSQRFTARARRPRRRLLRSRRRRRLVERAN